MNTPERIDDGPDQYGNRQSDEHLMFCCFPDCGCPGARLCMAESGPSGAACAINLEPREKT